MNRRTFLKLSGTAVGGIFLGFGGLKPARAQNGNSSGFSSFELTKPLQFSWKLPKNVVTSKPVEERRVNLATSDPWNPVDFETSFKLAEKGQADNMVILNGSTNIPLLLGHSGYFHGNPQSLEWLRAYLQGGRTNAEKTRMILYDETTEKRQLANFKGVKLTLSQESTVRSWSVAFVVKVSHKNVAAFSASADNAVVTTTQSMDNEELQEFLQRTNNGEKPLFMVTCYWGTEIKKSGWATYGRYVLVMFPDMPPDVK